MLNDRVAVDLVGQAQFFAQGEGGFGVADQGGVALRMRQDGEMHAMACKCSAPLALMQRAVRPNAECRMTGKGYPVFCSRSADLCIRASRSIPLRASAAMASRILTGRVVVLCASVAM